MKIRCLILGHRWEVSFEGTRTGFTYGTRCKRCGKWHRCCTHNKYAPGWNPAFDKQKQKEKPDGQE